MKGTPARGLLCCRFWAYYIKLNCCVNNMSTNLKIVTSTTEDLFTTVDHLQYLLYQAPLLLSFLVSASIRSVVHDVHAIAYSIGLFINSIIGTVLARAIAEPRPKPYQNYGQPGRAPQTLGYAIGFYVVFVYRWRRITGSNGIITLLVLVIGPLAVYMTGNHFTVSQVISSFVLGMVIGVGVSSYFHFTLVPNMSSYVARWNSHTIERLHFTHAYHDHLGRSCGEEKCTAQYTGQCIVNPAIVNCGGIGIGRFDHLILSAIITSLIHYL